MEDDRVPMWRTALTWLVTHRRKVLAAAIVAVPLISRYVPGVPADDVLSVLRGILGA